MRRFTTALLAVVVLAFFISMAPRPASAAEVPGDHLVVMYFHRTQRCPTCLKMGSYSEEAVKSGFATRIKDGSISFHYIDFQDRKNAAFTKGYGISGPALIIARTANGKVVQFKNLKDIWTQVADKSAFLQYVKENIAAYEAPRDRVVAMYFHRTQRCPTCLKMGSYSEEAVKRGFAQQVKDGRLAFYYVDFQDRENAALAKRYDVSGPALVVAKVRDNKVVDFKNLSEIWTKVADKPGFLTYVQENLAAYHRDSSSQNGPQDRVTSAANRSGE